MSYIACQVPHPGHRHTVTHHTGLTGNSQTGLGRALAAGAPRPRAPCWSAPAPLPLSARWPSRHLRARLCQKSVSVHTGNTGLTFCGTKRRRERQGLPSVFTDCSVSPRSVSQPGLWARPWRDSCEQDVPSPIPHGACHPQLRRRGSTIRRSAESCPRVKQYQCFLEGLLETVLFRSGSPL